MSKRKIKVAAVSYLNTKPLVYEFEQGAMADDMELIFDYPSRVASMLINDEVDMGLVPVAVIPQIKNAEIVSDFCIAASGPVASVCLFSHVPVQEIKNIILDYQSRTSVALLKILLNDFWKIVPEFTTAENEFESEISGTTAGLIIGDRALLQLNNFPFVYDLAETWQKLTGLPFVFAAWVSNKDLNTDFISEFNKSIAQSMNHIDEIVASNPFPDYDLNQYYRKNISYVLNDDKRRAVELFLGYLQDSHSNR